MTDNSSEDSFYLGVNLDLMPQSNSNVKAECCSYCPEGIAVAWISNIWERNYLRQ